MRRIFWIVAAVGFTVLGLWLSFRDVDWPVVREALAGANYALVATAVAASLFAVYALGWRWRLLLAPKARPSMATLFRWNILAQFANILIPARANEVVRTWLASAEGGTTGGFALGTIAVERAFDVAVFAACIVAGPAIFGLGRGAVPTEAGYALGAISIAALAALVFKPELLLRAAEFASRALPARWRAKTNAFLANAAGAFAALRNWRTTTVVVSLSALILMIQVVTVWIMFLAFRLEVPFGAAFFILLVRAIGFLPPAAPGRIGVFEYTSIVALAAYGIPRSSALGFALMIHAVAHIPKLILGAVFLGRGQVSTFRQKMKG